MKLLLVDDHREVAESLKEAIEPGGFQCFVSDDPIQALNRFIEEPFDAVITDYKMPGMNGIDFLKAIKNMSPQTPVIIMTGFADTDCAIHAVNYGAFAFYRKPIDIKLLLNTLGRIHEEDVKEEVC